MARPAPAAPRGDYPAMPQRLTANSRFPRLPFGISTAVEPADPTADAVDALLGRAALDASFRTELLEDPARALRDEPIARDLKRALAGIRAATLREFATAALTARERLGHVEIDPEPVAVPTLFRSGSLHEALAAAG